MQPIQYHDGQREVQREAGTAEIAERLTTIPPVLEFIRNADLLVIAAARQDTAMDFVTLSADPPLVQIYEEGDDFRLQLPSALAARLSPGTKCGGLLINLEFAMRTRVSGMLVANGDTVQLHCESGTRNCRKYIAPSIPISGNLGVRVGPASSQPLPFDSPLIDEILAKAETSFLATITPAGMPDVSHKGGAPGFVTYQASTRSIQWSEYLGSGTFLSTGNLRVNGDFMLLVLDIDTGHGLEIRGKAEYAIDRSNRREPTGSLTQEREPYPVRGEVRGVVTEVVLLADVCHPRQRIDKTSTVTACSTIEEQSTRYLADIHGYTEINIKHSETVS